MPQDWTGILVVTQDELVPAFYTADNLRQSLKRYKNKPYGIKSVQRGGNGRQLLIAFDSLPVEIKEALGDPRKFDHILEKFYRIDSQAVDFYTQLRFPSPDLEHDRGLDPEHIEQYITNASMIRALQNLKFARETERISKNGSLTGVLDSIWQDAMSFNEVLQAKHKVKHTLPTHPRRFKQALKAFEKEGYQSLISGKFGNQNTRKVTDRTVELLNALFVSKKSKPTPTEVAAIYNLFIAGKTGEVFNKATGEVYQASEFKELSEKTITRYLAEWSSRIGTHAKRSGDRQKYMQKYKPKRTMERPEFAGSLLSIDDRQPPFECVELDGKRIWFYNALDVAADAFTCWVHGTTKEGLILDFYRQLVRNYHEWGFNLPAELEAEMSLNSSFTNTFLKEGAMFELVRIEANNARGKIIESRYRTLRYKYEKENEGWQPRPFAKSESNQAGPAPIPRLYYDQIVEISTKAIQDFNNQPHPDDPKYTRWEYFCEKQNSKLRPTNYLAFLKHLGYKTETSVNAGIIRLNNTECYLGIDSKVALGNRLIGLMKQVEGKEIDVYWLDDNEGGILKALIYIGDQYVCEAVEIPRFNRARIEQNDQDRENIAIQASYTNTIESFGRKQKANLQEVEIMPTTRKDTKVVEILPEPETDIWDDQPNITPSFKRSLRDRY